MYILKNKADNTIGTEIKQKKVNEMKLNKYLTTN